jgi:heat shock protein HtpX
MALAYTEISKNKTRTWLLLILFIGFVAGVGFVIAELESPGAGMNGVIMATGIAIVWSWISYYWGDKMALKSNRAKYIEKRDNPELYRLVENLAITAGLPTPKIHIIDSPALNAFATGRDPNHASVAVTTGLMNKLDKRELEGVLAHEMSHVGNYDIRLLMVVTALFGVVMMIHRFWWYGGRSRRSGNSKASGIIMAIGFLFLLFGPLFASLIKLAISRKREFLADASGALLTRYPDGLASALEKISHDHTELKTATKGTAHLFFSNPFRKGKWAGYFSTHPPIKERIKALNSMDV